MPARADVLRSQIRAGMQRVSEPAQRENSSPARPTPKPQTNKTSGSTAPTVEKPKKVYDKETNTTAASTPQTTTVTRTDTTTTRRNGPSARGAAGRAGKFAGKNVKSFAGTEAHKMGARYYTRHVAFALILAALIKGIASRSTVLVNPK